APRVEEELHGREELRVKGQEDARRHRERQGQVQHRVEQVLGQDHHEGRGQEQGPERPEGYGFQGHSGLPSALAGPASGAWAAGALGGVCMSRSPLPVAHDGSKSSPMLWRRSLSMRSSRRSEVARSKDFIMMMASVGQTWTQSSQNSQA